MFHSFFTEEGLSVRGRLKADAHTLLLVPDRDLSSRPDLSTVPVYCGFSDSGFDDAISEPLLLCLKKSEATVPVRVARGIITVLASETRSSVIIQIPKPPRAANPRGVRAVERTPFAPSSP